MIQQIKEAKYVKRITVKLVFMLPLLLSLKSAKAKGVNKINNKVYVGSGDPLYTRLSDYYQPWYLVSRCNLYIVRAFNKHTMANFSLYILEYTNSDNEQN